jgi:hypothetical protein
MTAMIAGLPFLLLLFQDGGDEEKVFIKLPEFYANPSVGSALNSPVKLNLSKRRYFVQFFDEYGQSRETAFKEISQQEFSDLTLRVLSYGVLDRSEPVIPVLNGGYQNFVKSLRQYEILSPEELTRLAAYYIDRCWVESIYCLDQAFPGLIPERIWSNLGYYHGYNPLFEYLIRLKLSKNSVTPIVDDLLIDKTFSPSDWFGVAKICVEAVRRGGSLPESLHTKLLEYYFSCDTPSVPIPVYKFYPLAGLPLPSKQVAERTLSALVDKSEIVMTEIVKEFRFFAVPFPPKRALTYRNELMECGGELADIDFLSKSIGNEPAPESWKRYADFMFSSHLSKDARRWQRHSADYYGAAAEGYRRASAGQAVIRHQKWEALLKEFDDFSVHTKDLITVWELAGGDSKNKFWLEKLENRVNRLNKLPAGAIYAEDGQIAWLVNEYHQFVLPFRDEIELVQHLGERDRMHQLAEKIAQYAAEKLEQEGKLIIQRIRDHPRFFPQYWLFKIFSFDRELQSTVTPVYAELSAIIDYYQVLGFTQGLLALARWLNEYGCFFQLARRAFHLSGFGMWADGQLYGKHSDRWWQNQDEKISYRLRIKK